VRKMDDVQFKETINKLNIITRLLALNLVKDMKTQNEKILSLSSYGFTPTSIAEMLGTSSNTVNVALSRSRSKEKKQLVKKSTGSENNKQEIKIVEAQQIKVQEEKPNA